MSQNIEQNLVNLGITLPDPALPVANYVPCVIAGGLLTVSGQLPLREGGLVTGQLGADLTVEQGAEAAKLCAIQILAQAKKALDGDLGKIARLVRLGVFVSSTPAFTDHPKVANGASDLMVAVFGEAGKHARAAVGVPSLPLGAAVEVDAVFALNKA